MVVTYDQKMMSITKGAESVVELYEKRINLFEDSISALYRKCPYASP